MNSSQKVYIHRINLVIDFIEANLDKELSLQNLADVAMFSPFHFHRIFSAFTKETLNDFVKRARLEKAARYLIYNQEETIGDIAVKCGFNSVSVFCRAFKKYHGLSAQAYREANGDQDSKIDQLLRKNRQSGADRLGYVCRVESLKHAIMNKNIEIKDMPAMDLVYTRHVGNFQMIGQAYGKLMQWAGPRGLLANPNLKTVTVYHDDPNVTELDKVRQSACITVDKPVKTEGEFGNLNLPASKCVVGHFEIDATGFTEAWDSVCIWLSESGYQPADAHPFELYHNNHEEHPEKKFIVDICMPVKPL